MGRVRLGPYDRSKIEAPRRFALLSACLLGVFYVESSSGLFNFNSMRPSHPDVVVRDVDSLRVDWSFTLGDVSVAASMS